MTCMKNFLEKDKTLGIDLVNGLLKYWPITCPAKEVVYINEIEEILEKESEFIIDEDGNRKYKHVYRGVTQLMDEPPKKKIVKKMKIC